MAIPHDVDVIAVSQVTVRFVAEGKRGGGWAVVIRDHDGW
jgi:hypothetical protein